MKTKICSICEKEKELSEYYEQNKKKSDGTEYTYYPPYCKECTSKKAIENHESNRDKKLEYMKLQYNENKEQYRKMIKEWEENNKEYLRSKRTEWRRNNPDKLKEYQTYRNMNKTHKISNQEWEECKKYFNHRCAYCDLAIEKHWITFSDKHILGDFHREHVDPNGADDLSNCIPSCKSCNTSKHTSTFFEWYSSDNKNFEEERFLKIIKWLTEDYIKYINNKDESH